jgi:hypothetical protein
MSFATQKKSPTGPRKTFCTRQWVGNKKYVVITRQLEKTIFCLFVFPVVVVDIQKSLE